MSTQNLDRIFRPQRIALFGVSENPKSVAGTVLRNVVGSGFRGVVYPINPSCESVLGVHCYPGLAHLPRLPELAVVCAPATQVPAIVRECGEAGVLGLIIISAGFRETGGEGLALEQQVRQEAARFPGMRILGPNCLGVIVPGRSLNLTFAGGSSKPGRVAFVSQSGALCTSVLDWAAEAHVGFSYFVSVGNMIDVDFADLIDYFGEDESTDSIILYIESLSEARRFMTAARAFARTKPIVAYKAGRFPESEKAAASHTGALASEDAVYEAAFERAGIARVFEIGDIFNCVELIGRHKRPTGPRLGIITNAGGPGVMATDALMARSGVMAELSAATVAGLDEALPPFWSHGNPVDVLGDANSKRYAKALQILLADPGVDAVLAILTPQAMTNPSAIAREVAAVAGKTQKLILAAWLGGRSMREGIEILTAAGIATYPTPEDGVKAFMTLVAYGRNLEILYETPKDVPVSFAVDRAELRRTLAPLAERTTLSEAATKQLLEAYGIPGTLPRPASSAEEAVQHARQIGYPVVLKVLSPDISHKSDVGGVALDLRDDGAVRIAYEGILGMARQRQPAALLSGVTVQPMVQAAGGTEMILGTKKDPIFGSVILVGLGGVMAEVYRDRALGLPPLNERLARRMLESLRCWPLLQGYRGRPPVDLDRLIEIMIRFSYLVADCPEIVELDVNPLLVSSRDAAALDARAVIEPVAEASRPYAHLALRPYPEEQVRRVTLGDGAALTLRPIRPEDEPRWRALLASCSPEALYARFRYLFQWSTHEAATRYCFIDYDREIAIVAETEDGSGGGRALVGVGRLIADPDNETGEYAVLVTDAFQNRGLGGVLTDTCLEIARSWGIRRVVAETTADNVRMIALFQGRGFEVTAGEQGLVTVAKDLA